MPLLSSNNAHSRYMETRVRVHEDAIAKLSALALQGKYFGMPLMRAAYHVIPGNNEDLVFRTYRLAYFRTAMSWLFTLGIAGRSFWMATEVRLTGVHSRAIEVYENSPRPTTLKSVLDDLFDMGQITVAKWKLQRVFDSSWEPTWCLRLWIDDYVCVEEILSLEMQLPPNERSGEDH